MRENRFRKRETAEGASAVATTGWGSGGGGGVDSFGDAAWEDGG